MRTSRMTFVICALMLLVVSVEAKRKAPKPVAPVCGKGVCYSASGNGQDEYVVTTDAATGKEKWRLLVFRNRIGPLLERDVQDVFITDLELKGRFLIVRDEKARSFSIDVTTKAVKKHN